MADEASVGHYAVVMVALGAVCNRIPLQEKSLTTAELSAVDAAVAMLARGGHAVDAAIATSFALGAAEPWMSGMGGGGYMVVRMAGSDTSQVLLGWRNYFTCNG